MNEVSFVMPRNIARAKHPYFEFVIKNIADAGSVRIQQQKVSAANKKKTIFTQIYTMAHILNQCRRSSGYTT